MASILPRFMPSRRWLQFSLRTIMLFTFACALWLGWYVERARRQQRAVEAIEAEGGSVVYQHKAACPDPCAPALDPRPGPDWLCRMFGDEYFNEVIKVKLIANRSSKPRAPSVLADLPYLEQLYLEGMSQEELQGSQRLTRLRRLSVESANGVDLSWFVLNRELEEIYLWPCKLTDADLRLLVEFPKLRSVQLDLDSVADLHSAIRHVSKLHQLEELEIISFRITDDDIEPLCSLRKLNTLVLNVRKLTDQTLALLQRLPNLESLSISGGSFTRAGLDRLNKNLTHISLHTSAVSDAELTCFQRLPKLDWLLLGETTITDEGLASLKGMPRLTYFLFVSTNATAAGIRNIQQAMPNCRIDILR
jgi:hypothetical protein